MGGTAPYSYLWSNGKQLKQQLDYPQVHTVVQSDFNGCVKKEKQLGEFLNQIYP